MRWLPVVPILMLAACSEDPVSPDPIEAPGAEIVECAIGVGSNYAAQCPVERLQIGGEAVLVVHHPGGGFRRFTLANDGSGLTTYDGADEATRALEGDVLELSVGTDRYRFPARPIRTAPDNGGVELSETPDVTENAGS